MRQRLALAGGAAQGSGAADPRRAGQRSRPGRHAQRARLLRRLAAEGRTVFVSSHMLSEIQQTCDRVAILNRGRCVTPGHRRRGERVGGPRDGDARDGRRSTRCARRARPSRHPGGAPRRPSRVVVAAFRGGTDQSDARRAGPLGDRPASRGAQPRGSVPRADGTAQTATTVPRVLEEVDA